VPSGEGVAGVCAEPAGGVEPTDGFEGSWDQASTPAIRREMANVTVMIRNIKL